MFRNFQTLVAAAALPAAMTAVDAHAQSSNKPAVLGGNGRYVFGQINEYNADQYMLDTATGRLWRLVDTADGLGSVLELVPYTLPDGRTQPMPPDAAAFRVPPDEMPSSAPEESSSLIPIDGGQR